jgi:hypothetical protein
MAKPARVDRQVNLLLGRYRVLQDNIRARELLDACEKSVRVWRYSPRPMFPEVPFLEELYGGRWADKAKRNTFPHGFDGSGNLVLIQWYNSVAYRFPKGYLEAAFVNQFGGRLQVQVVRHIYRDATGRTKRVINLAPDCGYDSRYVYEEGRLVRIDSRHWAHDRPRVNPDEKLRITDEEQRTQTFQYSADGVIQNASPGNF